MSNKKKRGFGCVVVVVVVWSRCSAHIIPAAATRTLAQQLRNRLSSIA